MQEYFPTVVQVIPQTNYTVQVFLTMAKLSNMMQAMTYRGKFFNL